MTNLTQMTCQACEGGVKPLAGSELQNLLSLISGWELDSSELVISKEFKLENFREALDFIDKIGALAESEGHHPDLLLHDWNKVKITLTTHAIGGLSNNDFIMAAKIANL